MKPQLHNFFSKRSRLGWLSAIFLSLHLLGACNDDLSDALPQCSVEVKVAMKDGAILPSFTDASLKFSNLSSGVSTEFSYPLPEGASLMPGLYDISFTARSGDMEYHAISQSVEILSNGMLIRLEAFANRHTDDLIIAEVFFAGTLQTSGNQYYGDDYVKLYNNTDHVVYADGITLFESEFLTTEKRDYTPDRMGEGVTGQALYTIPGNGTDYPVMPGEYLLLADTGIDHRQVNPNSFDLSHADWEWYDVSSVPSNIDIDSPLVPNLDKWYCYTNSVFMLHNRGYRAIGIARISSEKSKFLAENRYSFDYELVTVVGSFPMSDFAYIIPNKDVVDVVNCSVASEWEWNVTDPALDRGWTGCGKIANDKTRYFRSVRRKLLYIDANGKAVLQDTNDSSVDFNKDMIPSEIEIQASVCGIDGERATTVTYDGITPVE